MLQWCTFLLVCLGAANASMAPGSRGTTCPCGTANRGRIVGGTKAQPNEYPWIVSLVRTYEGGSYSHMCGASLINERVAITAAHCTDGRLAQTLSVIAGTSDNTRPGQMVRVYRILQHENYVGYQDASKIVNDISLLLLAKDLVFGPNVSPVCMPTGKIDLDNEWIKVIGWGKLAGNLPASTDLMDIDIQVKPFSDCQRIYSTLKSPQTQICIQNPTKGACMGDSGGPLAILDPETNRYTLVGLVSWGSGICNPATPSVATEVSAFLPWIQSKISTLGCQKV